MKLAEVVVHMKYCIRFYQILMKNTKVLYIKRLTDGPPVKGEFGLKIKIYTQKKHTSKCDSFPSRRPGYIRNCDTIIVISFGIIRCSSNCDTIIFYQNHVNSHFDWHKFCGESVLDISCHFDGYIFCWTY